MVIHGYGYCPDVEFMWRDYPPFVDHFPRKSHGFSTFFPGLDLRNGRSNPTATHLDGAQGVTFGGDDPIHGDDRAYWYFVNQLVNGLFHWDILVYIGIINLIGIVWGLYHISPVTKQESLIPRPGVPFGKLTEPKRFSIANC